MLLEMEKKLIAKGFQYSTSKSHKKEKSSKKARKWLRQQERGNRRVGLVASSGAWSFIICTGT